MEVSTGRLQAQTAASWTWYCKVCLARASRRRVQTRQAAIVPIITTTPTAAVRTGMDNPANTLPFELSDRVAGA